MHAESMVRALSNLDSIDTEFEMVTVTETADLKNAYGLEPVGPDSFSLCIFTSACCFCVNG
jgi:hypothetical protein